LGYNFLAKPQAFYFKTTPDSYRDKRLRRFKKNLLDLLNLREKKLVAFVGDLLP
jgi:hypothetical protein